MNITPILANYDKDNITIGVLGGHSALDVCRGAKKYGFKTLAVCQKGREKTYAEYYKTNGDEGCIDEVLLVDSFADIVKEDVQEQLRKKNVIFIHNRYFWVYCNFEEIENKFFVPIYGTRHMVKLEERNVPNNQYQIMNRGNIRFPKIFTKPEDIDRLVIIKVNEANRSYERAFFYAESPEDFHKASQEMIKEGRITEEALKEATIEEYIVGAKVNFNFFYSNVKKRLEFMGTDSRRQTNLDGLLRLPATQQLQVLKKMKVKLIETGHATVTIKESLIEKAMELGEKFVHITKEMCHPGIIGPFGLQGAVAAEDGKEAIVIFDVSMRIPGSPGTMFTPYTGYLYGKNISFGERIAKEIREAIDEEKLHKICT